MMTEATISGQASTLLIAVACWELGSCALPDCTPPTFGDARMAPSIMLCAATCFNNPDCSSFMFKPIQVLAQFQALTKAFPRINGLFTQEYRSSGDNDYPGNCVIKNKYEDNHLGESIFADGYSAYAVVSEVTASGVLKRVRKLPPKSKLDPKADAAALGYDTEMTLSSKRLTHCE